MSYQFAGIFMRDTMNDNGIVPSTGENLWRSPDIISRKIKSENPQEEFKDFSQTYNTNMEYGQDNYIYVRCQNTALEERTGVVALYWSPSSLFLHPNLWINNRLTTSEGHKSVVLEHMQPNERRVGQHAFLINPAHVGKVHVCLIAMVTDELHCGSIPTDSEVKDWQTWVRDHANVAWKNLSIVDQEPDKSYIFQTLINNPTKKILTSQFHTDVFPCQAGTIIKNEISIKGFSKQETTTSTDFSLDYEFDVPPGQHQLVVTVTAPGEEKLQRGTNISTRVMLPGLDIVGEVHMSIN